MTKCSLCNKETNKTFLIAVQRAGECKLVYVCPDCKAEHDRELEMCRENYRKITEVQVER